MSTPHVLVYPVAISGASLPAKALPGVVELQHETWHLSNPFVSSFHTPHLHVLNGIVWPEDLRTCVMHGVIVAETCRRCGTERGFAIKMWRVCGWKRGMDKICLNAGAEEMRWLRTGFENGGRSGVGSCRCRWNHSTGLKGLEVCHEEMPTYWVETVSRLLFVALSVFES